MSEPSSSPPDPPTPSERRQPEPLRPGVAPEPRGPRLSRLAIVGLVLAILPCPPAGLFGSLMGLGALIQIRRYPERLCGQRIALAAIFAGALLAFFWTLVLESVGQHLQREENRVIAELLTETIQTIQQGEDPPPDVWATDPGAAPDPTLIVQFRDVTAECFGPLERVKVAFADRPDGIWVRVQPISAVFFFENETVTGLARVRLQMQQGTWIPYAQIVELDLDGKGACDPPALRTWPLPNAESDAAESTPDESSPHANENAERSP